MLVELSVRREDEPLREPAAWLLSGADPTAWLEEIVRWRLPSGIEDDVRLYVLPRSRRDGTAAGVLVEVPPPAVPAVRPAGAAYGRLGRRLLLPLEARLDPDIAVQELDSILSHDVVLFHPAIGFVGYREDEVRQPSSLLAFPRLSPSRWHAPPAPAPFFDRILSLSLESPSLDEFFREESLEISTDSPDEIPPEPGEPAEGALSDWKRKLVEPVARGLERIARQAPIGTGAEGLLARLSEWANESQRRITAEIERLRHKELHRLLHLLETDPQKGLRHALPLGGGTHRGLGRPGNRLSRRNVDFDLRAVAGGAPVDPWNVPLQLQQRLLAKYRELAMKERSLGRYRRAAYIYGELMGDLDTAAALLKEGKHYHEAAEVYRTHLGKPLEAARAFELGGFLREASELYSELEKWEEAGDVYRKMEREDQAEEAYRRARDQHLAERDRLGACRIVDTKLRDVDQAISIVESGWPDSSQASECLRRQLDIQARESLHRRTGALLDRLEGEATPPYLISALASCLAETATRYPDQELRRRAADLARRKISRRIPIAANDEASRLIESLYLLAPEDRLLLRDGKRYLSMRRERLERASRPDRRASDVRARRPSAGPEVLRRFDLPPCEWLELRSTGSLFFALGRDEKRFVLVRGNWSGIYQQMTWNRGSGRDLGRKDDHPLMELDASGHRTVLVWGGGSSFPTRVFPSTREVLEAQTDAGDPGWIPGGTLALAHRNSLWVALRHHRRRFVISTYSVEGAHLADLADWPVPDDIIGAHLTVQNHYIVAAQSLARGSSELLVFDLGPDRRSSHDSTFPAPDTIPIDDLVTGLRAALPYTRSRVAVTMKAGVLLRWLDSREAFVVASDLELPKASLLRNGSLVVASERTFRIYRSESREQVLTSELETPADQRNVVDVVSGYAPNQFAALTRKGRMFLYVLPSGGSPLGISGSRP